MTLIGSKSVNWYGFEDHPWISTHIGVITRQVSYRYINY